MDWIRAHPYASALCAAAILVIVGAFVVEQRTARPVEIQATAWGGGVTPLLNPTSYDVSRDTPQDVSSIAQEVKNNPPYSYIPPAGLTVSTSTDNSYDFESFVAMLTKESAVGKQTSTTADDSVVNAYAYIPRGLISTTTSSVRRTGMQQTLYEYGNSTGSSIESFEQQHSNMIQILKEQVEDRRDAGKAEALINLAHSFQDLGNSLAQMDNVPDAMRSVHQALAQSYIEMGKKLALIPPAERDADFIQAIQTYNASADTFTKNYIQIVSLFGAYGVTFSSTDGGKVFAFSPSGF